MFDDLHVQYNVEGNARVSKFASFALAVVDSMSAAASVQFRYSDDAQEGFTPVNRIARLAS